MSEAHTNARALIEQIARGLVDAPDQVRVESFAEDGVTVLELEVAETDMGKVIGRHGRTAKALRTLLDAVGTVEDRDYDLEILE
jgi:predicted RNA-binding protein YlqC (UPF0109 family)